MQFNSTSGNSEPRGMRGLFVFFEEASLGEGHDQPEPIRER